MGFIIVTSRNIIWLLLSLTAVMALVAGIITPRWLVGYKRFPDLNSTKDAYSPTVGLYGRCLRRSLSGGSKPWSCYRYIDGLGDLPSDFWKASFVFTVAGSVIACICVLLALVGFCVQNIGKKSLYSVVGVIQAIAGLLLIIGLVLYPAGWGEENKVVMTNCFKKIEDDNKPSAFKIGECTIGWAFYSALGGTVLLFLCAVLSAQAEKSTSSDRVQDEIYKGKTMICLP